MAGARRQVAVLGLGRFGQAVARELTRLGHDVLGIDANEKAVQSVVDQVTHAVQADVTDGEALAELGLADFDTVVVAVSSDLEASILATAHLRRIGVTRIIAKAANDLHGSILKQVGASRVVYPEHETGLRVAHSFAAPGVRDYLDVAPGYGVARVEVGEALANRSLGALDLAGSFGVTVMALHRAGVVTLNPHSSDVLRPGDELIVAGLDENLEKLPSAVTVQEASTPPRR
jgi:trk system potassium uptake protein TrkA